MMVMLLKKMLDFEDDFIRKFVNKNKVFMLYVFESWVYVISMVNKKTSQITSRNIFSMILNI